MCDLAVHCTHVGRAHYLASGVGPDKSFATSQCCIVHHQLHHEYSMLDSGSHASLRDAHAEINSIVSYLDIGSYVT